MNTNGSCARIKSICVSVSALLIINFRNYTPENHPSAIIPIIVHGNRCGWLGKCSIFPNQSASEKRLPHRAQRPSLADQLRDVLVNDAASLLDGVIARDDELWQVVPYLFERAVLAVLGRAVAHDGHCHLYVGVVHLLVPCRSACTC